MRRQQLPSGEQVRADLSELSRETMQIRGKNFAPCVKYLPKPVFESHLKSRLLLMHRQLRRSLCVRGGVEFKEAPMLIAHVLRDKGSAVFTLMADVTLEAACAELNTRKVGALVVLDGEGQVYGVLSERDLVREVARRGVSALTQTVGEAMTRTVITAEPQETLDECLGRMTDRRVRHLPVVENGRLIGIISIGDLVKHRIASAEAESAAMQAYISAH